MLTLDDVRGVCPGDRVEVMELDRAPRAGHPGRAALRS
jgi:hypothetical protein